MKSFVVTLFALGMASVYLEPVAGIVGGETASERLPYAVAIQYGPTHVILCGGAIIKPRYVLSSASCVYQSDSNQLSVWAGSNSLISLFGRRYEIQSKTIFPSFDASSGKDDIALLKTVLAFGFDGRVQPIALPTAQPGNGVRGMISGWGSLKKYPEYPINLNELSTVTISNAQCRSLTGKNISLDRLCTSAGAGKGACSGDSGGPLTVNNQLAGIASWSTPCAVGVADVYTCVYSYVSWIAANTI